MNNRRDLVTRIVSKRQRTAVPGYDRSHRSQQTLKRIEGITNAHDWLLTNCPQPVVKIGEQPPGQSARGKRTVKRSDCASKEDTVADESRPLDVQFGPEALELRRYTPVATVACLESYFRLCVRDLVDAGEPFSIRGAKLLDARVHSEFLAHIQDRKITLGELVSHTIRLSNLSDIDRTFSVILGVDFLSYIQTADLTEAPYEIDDDFNDELLSWSNDFYAALAELFEARHLYCHEFATGHDFGFRRMIYILVVLPSFVAVTDIIFAVAEHLRERFVHHVTG